MREKAKTIFQSGLYSFSNIFFQLTGPFTQREKSAIILAPSWQGSKGDEAVISACSSELKEKGIRTTLIHLGDKEWRHINTVDRWYGIPKYFSSGGWKDHFKFAFLFSKSSRFYLLGTDMLDGSYGEWLTNGLLTITHHAAAAGLKTNIVGISINTWQNDECMRVMGNLPKTVKIGVRDEIAWKRLSQILPHRKIDLTADIAFILRPRILSSDCQMVVDWTKNEKERGRTLMVVNINPVSFETDQYNTFFEKFIPILSKLHEAHSMSFLFMPHDFREKRNDSEFLSLLYERLPEAVKHDTLCVTKELTSEEIKASVSIADCGIVSRMHLAVALTSQAIPTVCITYQPVRKGDTSYSESLISKIHQDKFDGLMKHFNLSGLTISPEQTLDGKQLEQFVVNFIETKDQLKDQFEKCLPQVIKKSKMNLD